MIKNTVTETKYKGKRRHCKIYNCEVYFFFFPPENVTIDIILWFLAYKIKCLHTVKAQVITCLSFSITRLNFIESNDGDKLLV